MIASGQKKRRLRCGSCCYSVESLDGVKSERRAMKTRSESWKQRVELGIGVRSELQSVDWGMQQSSDT